MRFNNDPAILRGLLEEEARLKTFDSWKVSFIAKEDLAKNGFYYRGELDRCVCIFCGIEIGEWEEGDNPFEEHRKFSPNCTFFDLATDASPMDRKTIRSEDECGCVIGSRKIPRYTTVEDRFATFLDWPISMKQKPKHMAQAGFYYTGKGDKVICYSCDLGIHKWIESDDPWFEHARHNPRCGHVIQEKGREFIQNVLEKVARIQEQEKKELSNPTKKTEPNEALLCAVCKTQERSVVSLPCRHLSMCKRCNDQLLECPICRAKETASIEVIIP